MNYYIKGFRKLLRKKKLDAILIYANAYNDRYMKAVCGTYSVLQNYILVTQSSVYISEARYLVEDLRKRTTLRILPSKGEALNIYPIREALGTGKRIGIVGDCKYKDIKVLEPSIVLEFTSYSELLLRHKIDEYIEALRKHARNLESIMDSVRIKGGEKQTDIARRIKKRILDSNYDLAFPICVTSGKDLLRSTSLLASEKKIRDNDIICIDMGIKSGIYNTDRTRMYFLKERQAKNLYKRIKDLHTDIIENELNSKMTGKDIVEKYKRNFSNVEGVKDVLEEDFGHGIGFGLHEEPMLERSDDCIGKNTVFTIEPTFVTKYGKMRVEDMVGILSNGIVINLTKKSK